MAQSVDLLTQGGPFDDTQLVGSYANDLAFMAFRFAESEALASATGAVLLVLAHGPLAPLSPEAAARRAPAACRPVGVARPSNARERRRRRCGLAQHLGPGDAGHQRPPARAAAFLAWFGSSKRRTRRLAAVALFIAATTELIPLTSALQREPWGRSSVSPGPRSGPGWPTAPL